jgi:SAM-dependent methyltransferase
MSPIESTQGPAYDAWADYYDVAEGDRSDILAFYRSLPDARTSSVLELGCGTGAITEAVAAAARQHVAGARIAGVDASTRMLAIARKRDPTIEWLAGDLRAPPVDGRFDLVLCPFNTLRLLRRDDDLRRAFTSVRALLAEGGRFAFDVFRPNLEHLRVPKRDRLVRTVKEARGRALELREDAEYDAEARLLSLRWRIVESGRDGDPVAATAYQLRQYFPEDLERLLHQAGLRIVERFGDFQRRPWTLESRKQILICS